IQDDFRYLSVNLEVGGQIPSNPDDVIRRRYGDCKDLSLLLTYILRRLGVDPRPLLVHSHPGRALPDMLPSTCLFNHVIVEYSVEGQSYWVDPTFSQQGGGRQRAAPEYYHALPIQSGSGDLLPQPAVPKGRDNYMQHDTLM